MANHRVPAPDRAWWQRVGARLRHPARTPVPTPRRAGVDLVDALTKLTHRVSPDELTTGQARGNFIAFCGVRFMAACLVEPGQGRCRDCAS
jgi:hypothetical protein